MPVTELRGLSALEAWCRKATAGYNNVRVNDLSLSWRDGLAFCALIHHFRPDLIDFDELTKENAFHNNKLAFAIAEKYLNIPALLDAEDMVKFDEPDRLSVATYLSQFYERFEGSKNNRTSSSSLKKDTSSDDSCENAKQSAPQLSTKPNMKCHKCNLRVFILDRVSVDGRLYHKNCLETNEDAKSLEKESVRKPFDGDSIKSDDVADGCSYRSDDLNSTDEKIGTVVETVFAKRFSKSISIESENNGDSNDKTDSGNRSAAEDAESIDIETEHLKQLNLKEKTVNNTKLNVTEEIVQQDNSKVIPTINYPDDKNPFDDEEEEKEDAAREKSDVYPTDLNPFGDDDANDNANDRKGNDYNESLNPFGDDNHMPTPIPRKSLYQPPQTSQMSAAPRPQAFLHSPTFSHRKKRTAPTPPKLTPNKNSFSSITNDRRDSVISSTSSDFSSSSRTPTPQPRTRTKVNANDQHQRSSSNISLQNDSLSSTQESLSLKDDSMSRISDLSKDVEKHTFGYWKKQKRPAPPIPVLKRTVRSSIRLIQDELNEIGDRLPRIEKRGNELEKAYRSCESDGKTTAEIDEIASQFLKVVREKFHLACRQKELNYMKREHELEEKQVEIEFQLRVIMSKQASLKTSEDEEKESKLLQSLIEIVEERNDIVENMARDEARQKEDYQNLIAKFDLRTPINNNDSCFIKKELNESVTQHVEKQKKKKKKEKEIKDKVLNAQQDDRKSHSNAFTIGKSLKKLGLKSTKK